MLTYTIERDGGTAINTFKLTVENYSGSVVISFRFINDNRGNWWGFTADAHLHNIKGRMGKAVVTRFMGAEWTPDTTIYQVRDVLVLEFGILHRRNW